MKTCLVVEKIARGIPEDLRFETIEAGDGENAFEGARALHAGANEYIMKPFDRDIVAAKFQEVGLVHFTALA